MLTGLRMHAKGWKSLFVNERLIAAMAAEDITSFNTQRLRWGEGNLGIFAIDNPLTMKGLTWQQRMCYVGSMLSWTTGVQKLLIYATPMVMLLTGVAPVNKLTWQFALLVSVYLAADLDGSQSRQQWVRVAVGDRDDANGLLSGRRSGRPGEPSSSAAGRNSSSRRNGDGNRTASCGTLRRRSSTSRPAPWPSCGRWFAIG